MSKRARSKRNINLYVANPLEGQAHVKSRVVLTAYDKDHIVEKEIKDLSEIEQYRGKYRTLWLQITGLEDVALTNKVGEMFGLHALALEDLANTQQRAKVEQYDDYYFVVSHLIKLTSSFETRQVSMFFSKEFLITWQEGSEDNLTPVRDRVHRQSSRARGAGPDYLAYVVLDAVIDTYFPALENYGERLEKLEDEILEHATRENVFDIHVVKRELLAMRRAIWPLREAVNELIRDASDLLSDQTTVYMRDCYDHTVQVIDFLETYRELGSDLMDVYLSTVSNRMNEVMKVLTIITTILMPAGLIASIYGMNFHTESSPYNMPELTWRYGYPYALGMMGLTAVVTVGFLRWKGFIGGKSS